MVVSTLFHPAVAALSVAAFCIFIVLQTQRVSRLRFALAAVLMAVAFACGLYGQERPTGLVLSPVFAGSTGAQAETMDSEDCPEPNEYEEMSEECYIHYQTLCNQYERGSWEWYALWCWAYEENQ